VILRLLYTFHLAQTTREIKRVQIFKHFVRAQDGVNEIPVFG
jgi:hypothetical protein